MDGADWLCDGEGGAEGGAEGRVVRKMVRLGGVVRRVVWRVVWRVVRYGWCAAQVAREPPGSHSGGTRQPLRGNS